MSNNWLVNYLCWFLTLGGDHILVLFFKEKTIQTFVLSSFVSQTRTCLKYNLKQTHTFYHKCWRWRTHRFETGFQILCAGTGGRVACFNSLNIEHLYLYTTLHGLGPKYLTDMLPLHKPSRPLRSSETNLLISQHETWESSI